MSRSLEFILDGPVMTKVKVVEMDVDGDGKLDLQFSVEVMPGVDGRIGDLRGLFFDLGDESVLAGLRASGSDVTDSDFDANRVTDLGNGANMAGAHTNKGRGFDAGIEFGTQGIGKDDIRSTEFVLSGDTDLTLDLIGGMRFGARYTSVGTEGGPRGDSLKLVDYAPYAPDARDDVLETDEDTAASTNILTNDTDGDGNPLTVTSIEGGTVGVPFMVTTDGGRQGWVTVQADGTFAFDPASNFEELSTGDQDTVTLTYGISDGDGGTDHADVKVIVNGVNDAPFPVGDPALYYVEAGDTAVFDVLAVVTDVDGTVDPTTLVSSEADNGIASDIGGMVQYVADPIPYDMIDSSVADSMSFIVADNEGAASSPIPFTVGVIDPMRETAVDASNATNGQSLSVALSTEDRTYNTSSFAEVLIAAGGIDQDVNVSFVIDGSGSISSQQYAEQREAVQNTINQLRADFTGSAAAVTVQIVEFSTSANQGQWDLFDPVLNNVATGTPLYSQVGGMTNYEAGLDLAVAFFAGQADDDNYLLFTSDGAPNTPGTSSSYYTDEVAQLEALNVSRTAVGFGSANIGPLNLIDNTGGAQIVANAEALGPAFLGSPLFAADLIEFSLTVDGVEVADESDLTSLGGGDYSLDTMLLGLDNALAAANEVKATAWFDIDNDGVSDEMRVATTIIDGTDGTDILFA